MAHIISFININGGVGKTKKVKKVFIIISEFKNIEKE